MKSKLELLKLIVKYVNDNYVEPEQTIKFCKTNRTSVTEENDVQKEPTEDHLKVENIIESKETTYMDSNT